MTMLIIYEDECPYNPIVYVGKLRDNVDPDEAIREQIKFACIDAEIDTQDIDFDKIVYDLMGIANYCWVKEHYCFALKHIAEVEQ